MADPFHKFPPPARDKLAAVLPPFKVEQTRDSNERQGPGSGVPSWIVTDNSHHHVAGIFLDPRHAECWAIAFQSVYDAGFAAGTKSAHRSLTS